MTRIRGLGEGQWRGPLFAGVAVLALTVGLARPAGAATRFVATTGNDSSNTCISSGAPCKTITHALSQAVATDTIQVAAGTYNLALGETFPLVISKNLTLIGAGAGSTIFDATGANQRVITINSGTVTIAGVTITGGRVSCTASGSGSFCNANGGGLLNFGTATLTNVMLSGNTASCTGNCESNGGGLSNGPFGFGILNLTNSTVTGNTATCTPGLGCGADGGGLYNDGTLNLTNSIVSGNTATCTNSGSGSCGAEGGGIYSHHEGTLTVTTSTVSGNTATCTPSGSGSCSALGGGLTNNEGTLTLTASTVSGNTVSCTASASGHCGTQGGGLWLEGTLTLTNSIVSGNTASCSGTGCTAAAGGLLLPFDTLTLTNSTVSGNTASCSGAGCGAAGGGLTNRSDATLTLRNSTVSGNTVSCSGAGCTASGGGLINVSGTVTLQNTIVAKQLAGPDCAGTITSNGFNLDSDNTCHLTQPSDKPNVSNPLLGPLQDNGGPTFTHALLPGSPAIDAVTSGCPPPATDQRGVARPQDGTGDGTAACDIGAYEAAGFDAAAVSAFVTRLYQTVLGREPDPAGLAAFIAQIQSFGTVIPTVLAFFKSQEFLSHQLTDEQFLTVLYHTFLDRDPDPAGLAAFLALLQSGCRTRDTLIAALSFSDEFRSLVPPVPVADPRIPFLAEVFAWTLNRPPDPAGFQSFLAQLQRSTVLTVLTQFLHSVEFTTPRRSATDYVSALYLVFLGRPPDCVGLFSFVAALNPDTDAKRDQLAAQFAGSQEFQTILNRVFP
jgi:hypothetical protein